MSAAALVTPPLTLEHLKHIDFTGGQGVALDRLQVLRLEAAPPLGRPIFERLWSNGSHERIIG